jgi:putative two-component system response regulator
MFSLVTPEPSSAATIMVVDDTPANLELLVEMLRGQGYRVQAFARGALALQAARRRAPDLVLLDLNMPEMSGYDVCRELKALPTTRDVPIIFISAQTETPDKVSAFALGAVDFVSKPFQFAEVQARVATHLRLHGLTCELEQHKMRLEVDVDEKARALASAQQATIMALVQLASSRDDDTGGHIDRTRGFCRRLALALRDLPPPPCRHEPEIDDAFVDHVYKASALHDVGKVGIPDAILLKRGRLTEAEFEVMMSHVVIGANTLSAVLAQYPANRFLAMGMEICRHHHERWDGTGYPDRLAGDAIPLSARIMAVADVYDALRSGRPYKPGLDHAEAVRVMLHGDDRTSPTHFDPWVLEAFEAVADDLAALYDGLSGSLTPVMLREGTAA